MTLQSGSLEANSNAAVEVALDKPDIYAMKSFQKHIRVKDKYGVTCMMK